MAQDQLPPQAYTAEIIARAYDWLKSQPPPIQELAKSADALVSLYLKSKRSQPAKEKQTTESFQSDLKNLSEKMKRFDEFSEIEKRIDAHVTDQLGLRQLMASSALTNGLPQFIPSANQPQPKAPGSQQPVVQNSPLELDARTKQVLLLVQNALNLSSTDEAMRLLVQVGFTKLRDALPIDLNSGRA